MAGNDISFKQIVNDYGVRPGARHSNETLHEGQGAKTIYTASRWKDNYFGSAAKPIGATERYDFLRNPHDGPLSEKQNALLAEADGRHTLVGALHRHLNRDWPLTQRVLSHYRALYGRSLGETYVTRSDLYRLNEIAEGVKMTAAQDYQGKIVINSKIEATKRAVQIITERFKGAKTKPDGYEDKLSQLEELQQDLKQIDPHADPDAVAKMAKKAIKKIGIEQRFWGFGWLKAGVSVNFNRTRRYAHAAILQEMRGASKSREQEQHRMAINHIVPKLQEQRDQLDKMIAELERADFQDNAPEIGDEKDKAPDIGDEEDKAPEIGNEEDSAHEIDDEEDSVDEMDDKSRREIRSRRETIKSLKAVRDAIAKELPELSYIRSILTHLRAGPKTDYEKAAKQITERLERIEVVINEHEAVLDDNDVHPYIERWLHIDAAWGPAPVDVEQLGNGYNEDDYIKSPDSTCRMGYVALFKTLLDESETWFPFLVVDHDTIADRLAAETDDRPWIWTKMTQVPTQEGGVDQDGLYQSDPVKTPDEVMAAHRTDGTYDPPEIRREFAIYAQKNDGLDSYRKKILLLGQDVRHELLRRFEVQVMRHGHHTAPEWAKRLLDNHVTTDRLNREIKEKRAADFFRGNTWGQADLSDIDDDVPDDVMEELSRSFTVLESATREVSDAVKWQGSPEMKWIKFRRLMNHAGRVQGTLTDYLSPDDNPSHKAILDKLDQIAAHSKVLSQLNLPEEVEPLEKRGDYLRTETNNLDGHGEIEEEESWDGGDDELSLEPHHLNKDGET